MTTIDTLLTIAPRNLDDDAYRARIEARRERAHHFKAIDTAAIASFSKPQPRPRPAKKTRTRTTTTRHAGTAALAAGTTPCDTCKRPMRPHHTPAADWPGTIERKTNHECATCYQRRYRGSKPRPEPLPDRRPCASCGYPTRSSKTRAADASGTRQRKTKDLCGSCFVRGRKAAERGAA